MKKEMNKKKINGKILIAFLVMVICAVALFAIDFNSASVIEAGTLKEGYDYGEFTFLREMELSSGKTAYYYESGNAYYSYMHDNEGYVLVKDEDRGTLQYATNEDGVPRASGIDYGVDKSKLSTIVKMQGSDIDYSNPEVQESTVGLEGMTTIESNPVLSGSTEYLSITNLTIFISFYGETFAPDTDLINLFNGSSISLKSYYSEISNNKVNINSLMAYGTNGAVYVYQDPERRDYYNTNGSSRWTREVALVSNAIESAKQYFSLNSQTNLDVNGDGYIDSLSIIVHGQSSSVWGSLLWPHSVNLDAVDGDNNYTVVNGKKVGNYSFNFSDDIALGVLCHETAHVLGAPDLYHYGATSQNQDIVTVGKWDLMEIDLDTPQYLLAYMRKNYIGGIADSQIGTISENGTYSLKPVTSAGNSDVIAYKIPTSNEEEYFMVEYRRVTASGYDSMLPGSGLIIYRIREPEDFSNSRGNMDAVYRGTGSKADEVYVFRPSIEMTGNEIFVTDRYQHSRRDIDQAYLSPLNPNFSKVGKEVASGLYDFETLYYSDGSNSDIIIESLSISEESIEFSVRLGQDVVPDTYFDERITLNSAELVNATNYAGVAVDVEVGSLNPQYLSSLEVVLRDASGNTIVSNSMNLGRFLAEYNGGTRNLISQFIYADKGNEHSAGVFNFGAFLSDNAPVTAVLKVVDADGDSKELCAIPVSDTANIGWNTILNAKTELSTSIFASTRMTVGVRRDGGVDASGTITTGQWAIENIENITSVALGYTHTLLLTQSLNVIAVGEDNYQETHVSSWYDIKSVAAGTYCSYGLKTDGTVVASGLNDKGQLEISSWSSIKSISAMGKRVAGVTITGEVKVAGNFSEGEKEGASTLTNVKEVGVGLNYLVALKNDGSVQVVGTLPSADLSEFTGVKKISAGTHHIVALTEEGRVLATGDNSFGQSMVDDLYDIVDVAAGEYHTAYLREDGVVEYKGSGSTKYGTNEGIGNLLYSNYVELTEISGITGVSGGKIRIAKGTSTNIGVTVLPTNATYVRMIFTSYDEGVASVEGIDRDCATIVANEVGTTTITIKANGTGITSVISVEVYEDKPLEGIAFSEQTRSVLQGEKAFLTLIFLPEDGTYGNIVPTYTSSNVEAVTVNDLGVVECVGNVGESATITATAGGFSAQIVITIVGAVSGIEVDLQGNSTLYKYGEDLDLSRYSLKVTIGSNVENIAMTSDMVSGYDKTDKTSLTQTLTVSYMGVSTTFNVSVKDYVTGIEKASEPTKRYLYNYDLDAESGGFYVYKASGEVEGPHKFTASNYTGYNKETIGVQRVVYTYTDTTWGTEFKIVEEITVVDYVNSISFQPLRTTYLYGEEIDRHEFVEVNMISGAIRQMQLIECQVKDEHTEETDPSSPLYALYSLRVGAHQVKVTYVDPETNEEKSTITTINVEIAGDFKMTGRDESAFCYYYEIGSDPYLGISLTQEGVNDVVINKYASENDDIYYKLYSLGEEETDFDNSIEDDQNALVRVFVKRQTISGGVVSVANIEIWSLSINAMPLGKTINVCIKEGAVTEYKYGHVINGDGENLDIAIEKTMEDGTKVVIAPMEIVYDSELIGTQTLKARYLGTWLELEITINDYVVGIFEVEDIEIIWGEPISFEVYAIYARNGKGVMESDEYVISSYSNTTVGTQTVTISYLQDLSIFTTFKVIVKDQFSKIVVKDTPKTEYEIGEAFDTTSTYVITMISGATTTINYNTTDFYYTPEFNSSSSTVGRAQQIYIYYTGNNVTTPILVWSGGCIVPDFVTKLEVLSSSKSEYLYGEDLSISVRAYYAKDNTSQALAKKDYTTNYNPNKVGEQNIVVSYLFNGKTYTTNFTLTVIDTVVSINIASVPNRTSYNFGDIISWTGAKVNVTYASAGLVAYEGDEIKKNLIVEYTTLVQGQQRVTVKGGSVSAFFNIRVNPESQSVQIVNTDNITPSLTKKQIALKEGATISEVVQSLVVSDYLTPKYQSIQYGSVMLGGEVNKSAGTGDRLYFINKEGVEVFSFIIYLKGDVNGDGKVDVNDLPGMAEMLAQGNAIDEIMDYNEDGKSNLTDLVGYARKTSGSTPEQVPISDVARTVIATPSRLGNKEKGNE